MDVSLSRVRNKGATDAKLTIVVDGYNAPVTAGNFVDLVDKKFYDKMDVQRADGFVVQTGDPGGDVSYMTISFGNKQTTVDLRIKLNMILMHCIRWHASTTWGMRMRITIAICLSWNEIKMKMCAPSRCLQHNQIDYSSAPFLENQLLLYGDVQKNI